MCFSNIEFIILNQITIKFVYVFLVLKLNHGIEKNYRRQFKKKQFKKQDIKLLVKL